MTINEFSEYEGVKYISKNLYQYKTLKIYFIPIFKEIEIKSMTTGKLTTIGMTGSMDNTLEYFIANLNFLDRSVKLSVLLSND